MYGTRCKCPLCGKEHSVCDWWFNWTGRGMPRKYCFKCRRKLNGQDQLPFTTYDTGSVKTKKSPEKQLRG